MAEERYGICPVCESHLAVGALCPVPACARRGYRAVPAEYLTDDDTLRDPLVGQAVGDYLVAGFLGAGGFGRVYLALQLPILLRAALKLLNLDWVPESARAQVLDRFEGEALALALVQHPNIVRLLHYGSFLKRPYLVMEYVGSASTLEDEVATRAARGERFAPWEVRAIVGQLLDGLTAAHERNVIHRDIKPGNLMLQRAHGHPLLVRILDFGLAKFLDGGNRTAATTGTPDYMAPEQIASGEIGPWTDLYAAGSIAFELLTGQRPFPGEDMQQTFFFKMNRGYDPAAAVAGLGLPAEVTGFLRRALAWNPNDRFRQVEAFRLGFDAACAALERDGERSWPRGELAGLAGGGREYGELASAATRPVQPGKPSGDQAFREWLAREQERLGLNGDD
jgi:serine/threonine-protein kinase